MKLKMQLNKFIRLPFREKLKHIFGKPVDKVTFKEGFLFVGGLIAIPFFFCMFIYRIFGGLMMQGDQGRLTIGESTHIYRTARGGRHVSYLYFVNGKPYTASTGYSEDIKVPNGKYVIRFWIKNPDLSDVLTDRVADEALTPPQEGWTNDRLRIISESRD
jgi:hypothetical protein